MTSIAPTAKTTDRDVLLDQFTGLLGRLKKRVAAGMPQEWREQMEGATQHQVEALFQLAKSPDGMTMHDVAKEQSCALSTATSLVDRLVQQGLAERRDDPNDRRVVRIVASERAQSCLALAHEGKHHLATDLLAPLTDTEVQKLVTLLTKITTDREDA
jgi:DNA-binding MarR family transcriptional regulator